MDIGTILSDGEDDFHATSEEEEEVEKVVLKPVLSKKKQQKKNLELAAQQKQVQAKLESETSLFESLLADKYDEPVRNTSSWDFQGAIAAMKQDELNSGKTVQTSLDDKIRRMVERRKQDAAIAAENDKEEEDKASSSSSDSNDEEEEEEDKPQVVRRLRVPGGDSTAAAAKAAQPQVISFSALQLSRPLLRAAQQLNYASPTPIQAQAIPLILQGRDVLASAVTGSGKTAAYLFPLVERLLLKDRRSGPATRVLILVPTRELAQQVSSMLEKICEFCADGIISQTVLLGGVAMIPQSTAIRARPDIIIATPGRLIDHLRNTLGFDINDLEILILDEGDRLLELGFADSLKEIVKYAPPMGKRQTLMFSATISQDVSKLADLSLNKPVRIQTDPMFDVAQRLVQEFVRVRKSSSLAKDPKDAEVEQMRRREAILHVLCTRTVTTKTIIFFTHKRQAHRTCVAFGLLGLKCGELHGNLTQAKRLEALERFRKNEVDFLFCTDLAARGIDIPGIACVINFDLPKDLTTYVHRVGRTARAGKGGRSISLVGEDRRSTMRDLLKSNSSSQFQSRTVGATHTIQSYDKLVAVSNELEKIMGEERNEREIRLAEVDANKVENLIVHHDEIMSRPKKTWFQSKFEKDQIRQQGKDAFDGVVPVQSVEEIAEEEPERRERVGNRAKRRRVAARENEEKERRRYEREAKHEENQIQSLDIVPNEVKQKMVAKEFKKLAREGGDDLVDRKGNKKRRIDDSAMLTKMTKGVKARRPRLLGDNDSRDNFVNNRSKQLKELTFKPQVNPLRKGGKKGQHKFKSKLKYKRR
ncbi:hypothetical protein BASA81_003362 [Batrachochytrium salamandrivorans]|nr:hypothetical protein BASA81_003362 [Batrachochytrium salamandrivorans]